MANWYIGQDVVAIRTHEQHCFKEGDIFTIRGLRLSACTCCGEIQLDIGRCLPSDYICICNDCGVAMDCNGIEWHSEYDFKPLDELADISELVEVLNEPIFR